MTSPTDRITAVLKREIYDGLTGRAGPITVPAPAHVAEQVAAELMSWDFLMALLDEHYPEDVFPTMADRTDRDPGPRIVSLIRYLDATRRAAVEGKP